MRFSIQPQSCYEYSAPVFLEPHVVGLTPRCDLSQRLHRFDLTIDPTPAGRVDGLDAENNAFTQIWFEGLHSQLDFQVDLEVETLRKNPFAGLLTESADRLPLALRHDLAARLSPYLGSTEDPAIEALAGETMKESNGDSRTFLSRLCSDLYARITLVCRMEAGIQTPAATLKTRRGACRDVTVVFMEACRSVGIPARFVSGYQRGDDDEPHRDLHAWAECFLPGLGWRGYDPSHGLAVADDHIPLVAAAHPQHAAPVIGSYRGKATSREAFSIKIDTRESCIS